MSNRKAIISEIERFLCLTENGYKKVNKDHGLPRCVELQMEKNGEKFYFSVMALTKNNQGKYFGSTNSTEWSVAFEHLNNFYFVLYRTDCLHNNPKKITLFSPQDILSYATLPSFKINVSIPEENPVLPKNKREGILSTIKIQHLVRDYNKHKKEMNL